MECHVYRKEEVVTGRCPKWRTAAGRKHYCLARQSALCSMYKTLNSRDMSSESPAVEEQDFLCDYDIFHIPEVLSAALKFSKSSHQPDRCSAWIKHGINWLKDTYNAIQDRVKAHSSSSGAPSRKQTFMVRMAYAAMELNYDATKGTIVSAAWRVLSQEEFLQPGNGFSIIDVYFPSLYDPPHRFHPADAASSSGQDVYAPKLTIESEFGAETSAQMRLDYRSMNWILRAIHDSVHKCKLTLRGKSKLYPQTDTSPAAKILHDLHLPMELCGANMSLLFPADFKPWSKQEYESEAKRISTYVCVDMFTYMSMRGAVQLFPTGDHEVDSNINVHHDSSCVNKGVHARTKYQDSSLEFTWVKIPCEVHDAPASADGKDSVDSEHGGVDRAWSTLDIVAHITADDDWLHAFLRTVTASLKSQGFYDQLDEQPDGTSTVPIVKASAVGSPQLGKSSPGSFAAQEPSSDSVLEQTNKQPGSQVSDQPDTGSDPRGAFDTGVDRQHCAPTLLNGKIDQIGPRLDDVSTAPHTTASVVEPSTSVGHITVDGGKVSSVDVESKDRMSQPVSVADTEQTQKACAIQGVASTSEDGAVRDQDMEFGSRDDESSLKTANAQGNTRSTAPEHQDSAAGSIKQNVSLSLPTAAIAVATAPGADGDRRGAAPTGVLTPGAVVPRHVRYCRSVGAVAMLCFIATETNHTSNTAAIQSARSCAGVVRQGTQLHQKHAKQAATGCDDGIKNVPKQSQPLNLHAMLQQVSALGGAAGAMKPSGQLPVGFPPSLLAGAPPVTFHIAAKDLDPGVDVNAAQQDWQGFANLVVGIRQAAELFSAIKQSNQITKLVISPFAAMCANKFVSFMKTYMKGQVAKAKQFGLLKHTTAATEQVIVSYITATSKQLRKLRERNDPLVKKLDKIIEYHNQCTQKASSTAHPIEKRNESSARSGKTVPTVGSAHVKSTLAENSQDAPDTCSSKCPAFAHESTLPAEHLGACTVDRQADLLKSTDSTIDDKLASVGTATQSTIGTAYDAPLKLPAGAGASTSLDRSACKAVEPAVLVTPPPGPGHVTDQAGQPAPVPAPADMAEGTVKPAQKKSRVSQAHMYTKKKCDDRKKHGEEDVTESSDADSTGPAAADCVSASQDDASQGIRTSGGNAVGSVAVLPKLNLTCLKDDAAACTLSKTQRALNAAAAPFTPVTDRSAASARNDTSVKILQHLDDPGNDAQSFGVPGAHLQRINRASVMPPPGFATPDHSAWTGCSYSSFWNPYAQSGAVVRAAPGSDARNATGCVVVSPGLSNEKFMLDKDMAAPRPPPMQQQQLEVGNTHGGHTLKEVSDAAQDRAGQSNVAKAAGASADEFEQRRLDYMKQLEREMLRNNRQVAKEFHLPDSVALLDFGFRPSECSTRTSLNGMNGSSLSRSRNASAQNAPNPSQRFAPDVKPRQLFQDFNRQEDVLVDSVLSTALRIFQDAEKPDVKVQNWKNSSAQAWSREAVSLRENMTSDALTPAGPDMSMTQAQVLQRQASPGRGMNIGMFTADDAYVCDATRHQQEAQDADSCMHDPFAAHRRQQPLPPPPGFGPLSQMRNEHGQKARPQAGFAAAVAALPDQFKLDDVAISKLQAAMVEDEEVRRFLLSKNILPSQPQQRPPGHAEQQDYPVPRVPVHMAAHGNAPYMQHQGPYSSTHGVAPPGFARHPPTSPGQLPQHMHSMQQQHFPPQQAGVQCYTTMFSHQREAGGAALAQQQRVDNRGHGQGPAMVPQMQANKPVYGGPASGAYNQAAGRHVMMQHQQPVLLRCAPQAGADNKDAFLPRDHHTMQMMQVQAGHQVQVGGVQAVPGATGGGGGGLHGAVKKMQMMPVQAPVMLNTRGSQAP